MHILIDLSFFLTNKIDAPYSEWFGLIKPLSKSSYNCFFNFWSSVRTILNSALEIGTVPKANLILNSNFFFIVNSEKLSGNISRNSCTIKVSLIIGTVILYSLTICAKYLVHFLLSIFLPWTLLIIILRTQAFVKVNFSLLSRIN